MIGCVEGTIEYISNDSVCINTGGVGFDVCINQRTMSEIGTLKNNVKLYTHMSVSTDNISIYGFMEYAQLYVFKQLITVSNVGPKAAMSLLNVFSASQLCLNIVSKDVTALTQAKGIGKKAAERIALELGDSISLPEGYDNTALNDNNISIATDNFNEAIDCLTLLGYSRSDAYSAVKGVTIEENDTTETIVNKALLNIK